MLLKHPRSGASPQFGVTRRTEDVETCTPQNTRYQNADSRLATVVYGNFLLAVITLPSGIASKPTLSLTDLAAVSFLGIVQIGVAYILFVKGVTLGTRPLDASIIGFIEPLLNPVWVFLFVGERPSNWAILGGAIIVLTVAAHTIVRQRSNAPT